MTCTATSTSRPKALLAGAALALALLAAAPAGAQVIAVVDLGLVADSRPVTASFSLTNPSPDRPARVDLISGCGCLAAAPDRLFLAPGATAAVRVTYTPEGRTATGEVSRSLFTRSSLPELDKKRVLVTASLPAGATADQGCDECRKVEEMSQEDRYFDLVAESVVLVDFYFDPGCASCREYLERELPSAARRSQKQLRLARHGIGDGDSLAQLAARLRAAGQSLAELPVAFVGDRPYQGLAAIRRALHSALSPPAR